MDDIKQGFLTFLNIDAPHGFWMNPVIFTGSLTLATSKGLEGT